MSWLVSYVDGLDDTIVEAHAESRKLACDEAWRLLIAVAEPGTAHDRYRREVRELPEGAGIRWLVVRTTRPRTEVCTYAALPTARSCVEKLRGLTDARYIVRPLIETPSAVVPALVECPACGGAGERTRCANDGSHGCSHTNDEQRECWVCRGEGELTPEALADAAARERDGADEHDVEPEPWATAVRP